ncbi:MAG TPA: alternative ribosome rescue aminoacyl-tRNA hydrolase ArfB [Thermoanaerobaculia bacterium]|nr:alternative ribosome rescue aminoacyl-tRNA hydrolase ArfB [Thermoanaerobaculia bacterium]
MADPIDAPPAVFVPPAAIEVHAVRASGPGGQNVNKVASKILLEIDLAKVDGLDGLARRRLATLAGRRLGADGILRLTAQRSRDQYRNLSEARDKAKDLLEKAQAAPRSRRATRPSRAVKEERLASKKRTGAVKAARRLVRDDD